MTLTAVTLISVVFSFAFLVAGVAAFAIINRFLYPGIRMRHEERKLTASQGADPYVIMGWLKILCFIVAPAAGFFLGNAVAMLF